MDVLERGIPGEAVGFHVDAEPFEAGDERRHLVGGQDPRSAQPADVGDRAVDVVEGEGLVELDRPAERGREVVCRPAPGSAVRSEPAAPESHPSSFPRPQPWARCHGRPIMPRSDRVRLDDPGDTGTPSTPATATPAGGF